MHRLGTLHFLPWGRLRLQAPGARGCWLVIGMLAILKKGHSVSVGLHVAS